MSWHVWQGIMASIPTLVNDTVGCLAGARYADGSDANVAVIMGSGRPLHASSCVQTSLMCWLAVEPMSLRASCCVPMYVMCWLAVEPIMAHLPRGQGSTIQLDHLSAGYRALRVLPMLALELGPCLPKVVG